MLLLLSFFFAVSLSVDCPEGTKYIPKGTRDPNVPNCPGNHCSLIADETVDTCYMNGWGADHSVIWPWVADKNDPLHYCYCKCVCSCMAATTLVRTTTGYTKLGETGRETKVMVLDLRSGEWNPSELVYSAGMGSAYVKQLYQVTTKHQKIICDGEQVWLVSEPKGHFVRAKHLDATKHKLVDAKTLQPVEIVDITVGVFPTPLWHVATPADASHLLDVEGIVAGDFYLQTTMKIDEGEIPDSHFFHPKPHLMLVAGFYPSSDLATKIPRHAKSLIPRWMEPSNEHRKLIGPITSNIENSKVISALFSEKYPDINFSIDEHSSNVNAFSWQEVSDRSVVVMGGLVRHKKLSWEGVAVIFARQTVQLLGLEPIYEDSVLSCEYVADWGMYGVLQNVFPLTDAPTVDYQTVLDNGLDQLQQFFSALPNKGVESSHGGCGLNDNFVNATCRVSIMANGAAAVKLANATECWFAVHETEDKVNPEL